jgi:outer membrane murein-binding lipoprotein Lpp
MGHRNEQAKELEALAEELETAAAHCRVAAVHLIEGEVPRFAAHSWAAYGHARRATDRLDEQATKFADRAVPVATDET